MDLGNGTGWWLGYVATRSWRFPWKFLLCWYWQSAIPETSGCRWHPSYENDTYQVAETLWNCKDGREGICWRGGRMRGRVFDGYRQWIICALFSPLVQVDFACSLKQNISVLMQLDVYLWEYQFCWQVHHSSQTYNFLIILRFVSFLMPQFWLKWSRG